MKYMMVGLTLFLLVMSSWAGTFMDDFEDGNMDEWASVSTGAGGNWKIENGELILQSKSPGDFIVYTGKDTWKDYTIKVKLKPSKDSSGMTSFRITGNGLYSAGLGGLGTSRQFVSYYFSFVKDTIHHEEVPFDWEPDTWYVLKAVIEGDYFKYYVNDELVMEYIDTSNPTGAVGLIVSGASTTRFDNFFVTGDDIPGNVTAVSPKGKVAVTWGQMKNH